MPPKRKATAATARATRNTRRKVSPDTPTQDTNTEVGETQNEPDDKSPSKHEEPMLTPAEVVVSPATPPPVTPPALTATPRRTPRVFMECVELPSPARMISKIGATPSGGSPVPSSGRRRRNPRGSPTPTPPRVLRSSRKGVSFSHEKIARSSFDSDPEDSRQIHRETSPLHLDAQTPRIIPEGLCVYLEAQKASILKSMQDLRQMEDTFQNETKDEEARSTNQIAYDQLSELLKGTILRGEGNSCLLIGPCGSGKTALIGRAIDSFPEKPIVIRLSGHVQHNDRLAIREIAWQLAHQTGRSFLPTDLNQDSSLDDPDNPFVDAADPALIVPSPSHLLALISVIPTLPRPTIIILDAFDLFATHARQSLLYCLLDTAQSCGANKGTKGIAVIGVTNRVDTINLLEKRVKSRFSGRMLRTACVRTFPMWINYIKCILSVPALGDVPSEWSVFWDDAVESFLQDKAARAAFKEAFALTGDLQLLCRILTALVLELTPASPRLEVLKLDAALKSQQCLSRSSFLSSLTYPAICLLIAAIHAQTTGHDEVNFEMLYESFRDQVRTSQSAPVQVEGGGIGMVRCSREVLQSAFEQLISMRAFEAAAPSASSAGREFALYRCTVNRSDVKKAVDTMGQTNLRKWLSKAQ